MSEDSGGTVKDVEVARAPLRGTAESSVYKYLADISMEPGLTLKHETCPVCCQAEGRKEAYDAENLRHGLTGGGRNDV